MVTMTSTDISFSAWAKEKCTLYPEIVKHMRNSTDPLERAIAIRIMKVAEVSSAQNFLQEVTSSGSLQC